MEILHFLGEQNLPKCQSWCWCHEMFYWNVILAKMKNVRICFVVFLIITVQSIQADSDPVIIEGIIEDVNQEVFSNEPRNGRQFQQLQARSASSAKQNPEELISGMYIFPIGLGHVNLPFKTTICFDSFAHSAKKKTVLDIYLLIMRVLCAPLPRLNKWLVLHKSNESRRKKWYVVKKNPQYY